MDHRQRLEACIAGKPVDRPPVALWRHFPVDDQDPTNLASAICLFQTVYDFDFVKITPASSFCVNDYGVQSEWKGNPEGTRDYTYYPIHHPMDWLNLHPLSLDKGALKSQLECIKQVRTGIDQKTPILQTIFDPMSQAKNLVGRETLLAHMRLYPQELKHGLKILAENTKNLISACIQLGIDGVFLAVQHAQANLISRSEFDEFIIPFDMEILDIAKSLWLNVAHIHGNNIYFSEISALPVEIINWHDQETLPCLNTAKEITSGVVCGGLQQWKSLVYGTPATVAEEAHKAIASTNGEKFILGTGCVLPITAPHGNIMAARKAVEKD